MSGVADFDKYACHYDQWFEEHAPVYQAELRAIQELWPDSETGIEIGVGSGRFANPLGIRHGLDPSAGMRELAQKRGINAVDGVAESLPYGDGIFDAALMVTTLCFVQDPEASIRETFRVLQPGGVLVVAMIDKASPLGQSYEKTKDKSRFYRYAHFLTVSEVVDYMIRAGFVDFAFRQTLFRPPDKVDYTEPVEEGYGIGSFVVVRGRKLKCESKK